MPIRHGLPTLTDEDTGLAVDRATTALDTGDATTEDDTWPYYPFDQVQWLSDRLQGPTIPAAVFNPTAPLPRIDTADQGGGLTLPYARALILPKTTPGDLVDRVWRYIAAAAREQRGDWNLFALGMGRIGLHKQAHTIAPKGTPSARIFLVQHIMAAHFLIRMHATDEFDLDKPRVYGRLKDHAVYAGKGHWREANRDRRTRVALDDHLAQLEASENSDTSRRFHEREYGHPYLALLRLIDETKDRREGHRLTRQDAALVALTYLDGYTVAEAATILGLPKPTAKGRHNRAKHLIGRLLASENKK